MAKNKPKDEVIDEESLKIEAEQPELPSEEPKEETAVDAKEEEPKQPNFFQRCWKTYKSRKRLTIPLTILVFILISIALPQTRYSLIGLFMKKDVIVYVLDDKTHSPILGDKSPITIDGRSPDSGSAFPAVFKNVPVGKHRFHLESGYYMSFDNDQVIGIGRSKVKHIQYSLIAPDRGAFIVAQNKITGKKIEGVRIKYEQSEAVTNKDGYANIVVSASHPSLVDIELSGAGYNNLKTKFNIDKDSYENSLVSMTPAGKVYFLSKLSGKIDVAKTDLDGSNRETVLAGTGSEEDTNTVLLASRDWKYVALQSRRDGARAKLFLIDTSSDKLVEMDSGDATFSPIGWQDHHFVYKVSRDSVQTWQGKKVALKTYNAETQQLVTIDETVAEGTGNNDYASDNINNVYLLRNTIIYDKTWSASYYSVYRLAAKRMGIYSVKTNGTDKKLLKDFDVANNGYISASLSGPEEIHYGIHNAATSFYTYENGSLKENKELTNDSIYKPYPTFLLSPSGTKTFWFEARDGKNTLLVGTADASNGKEIASLSEYIPYGWYSDDYVLVSKNSSELYILPTSESVNNTQILKITDYHKPAISFYGYGGF